MNARTFQFLARLMILLFVIPPHECAHGVVAGWLGDDTAKLMGRNTLNPFKHLDPIGSILLLFAGFGWAKPVPVTGRYFKNFKRDMALTALAGPVANLLMAVLFAAAFKISANFILYSQMGLLCAYYLIWTTLALAVFNMIPIPPLDGSRILTAILPDKLYYTIMRYERVIMGILMAGLFFGVLSFPIEGATNALYRLVDTITKPLGTLPYWW